MEVETKSIEKKCTEKLSSKSMLTQKNQEDQSKSLTQNFRKKGILLY